MTWTWKARSDRPGWSGGQALRGKAKHAVEPGFLRSAPCPARGRDSFIPKNGVLSMNTLADATVPEKILLAAFQLEEEGKSPFSAEDLIVSSWKKFPKTLGLKGYAEM